MLTSKSYRLLKPLQARFFSSLPKHEVVGMPSLSPTMTTGTIGKWNVKVGDKASPGVALAEVETDKAIVTFESQDDFIIAKILVEAGKEVKVGDPIMVTVDEAEFVKAFENFALTAAPAVPAAQPSTKPAVEAPKASPAPEPTVQKKIEQTKTVESKPPTPPTPATKPVPPLPSTSKPAPSTTGILSFQWGTGVAKSPLAKKIAADQTAYIAKYGRSAQKVVLPAK